MSARRTRPSWYHGWNIVAVCVLAQSVGLGLSTNCFSLFLETWTRQFGTPISTLALAITALSVIIAIVVPFAGALADKFPARWLFGGSMVGLVLFHGAMGFVTAGWQIVALYAIVLPFAMAFSGAVPSQTVVSRWFKRRVGLAMGITGFGLAAAGIVLPPLVALLLPIMGWRGVWWPFTGLIAIVVAPIVLATLRDKPAPDEGVLEGFEPVGQTPGALAAPALRLVDIFRRRNFWLILGSAFPLQCASLATSVNLVPMLGHHGIGPGIAGGLMSLTGASALAAKVICGLLADRFGHRWLLAGVALLCAAGVALLALGADQLPLIFIALVLLGFSGANWVLLASATAAEFGAEGFGRAFGLTCAFVSLGAVAPPIVARIQEVTGSYAPGFLGLCALALVGATLGLSLKERGRGGDPPTTDVEGAPMVSADPVT